MGRSNELKEQLNGSKGEQWILEKQNTHLKDASAGYVIVLRRRQRTQDVDVVDVSTRNRRYSAILNNHTY